MTKQELLEIHKATPEWQAVEFHSNLLKSLADATWMAEEVHSELRKSAFETIEWKDYLDRCEYEKQRAQND